MKLSIITVNLNNKVGLQKTIDSVISQTFKDYEWIVVDGGSTDGSKELIEKYSNYISYWVSEPDKGIYNAMNKGIRVAKGEYLNFLNSGDFYLKDDVLGAVFSIEHSADILYGGKKDYRDGVFVREKSYAPGVTFDVFLKGTICHQSSFIKANTLKNCYDETLKICSDYKLFVSLIMSNHKFEFLNILVAASDVTGISSNIKNKDLMMKEREEIMREFVSPLIMEDYYRLHELENIEKNELVIMSYKIYKFNRVSSRLLRSVMQLILFVNRLFGCSERRKG